MLRAASAAAISSTGCPRRLASSSAASSDVSSMRLSASLAVPADPTTSAPTPSSAATISSATSGSSSTTKIRFPASLGVSFSTEVATPCAAPLANSAADDFIGRCSLSGKAMFQTTPSASIDMSASPPSPFALCSINVLPKPRLAGARTTGPPRSSQRRRSVASATDQLMVTIPFAVDSAPYLIALVPSSWSISAVCSASCASRWTAGPQAVILVSSTAPASN